MPRDFKGYDHYKVKPMQGHRVLADPNLMHIGGKKGTVESVSRRSGFVTVSYGKNGNKIAHVHSSDLRPSNSDIREYRTEVWRKKQAKAPRSPITGEQKYVPNNSKRPIR